MTDADPEFTFELRVCRWAEQRWPPRDVHRADTAVLVARQLGTRRRRWDVIVVEVDREALAERRRFGTRGMDRDLLRVVRNAPANWEWYRDALPDPDFPWRYVREAVHRAADRDLVETRTRGRRIELRRIRPYPDWVERIVAIENKPDLDASAARRLRDQVEHDVALALADEVWIATRATGERVEPALLENLPVSVGLLAFDFGDREATTRLRGTGTTLWRPRSLEVDEPGTRILDRPSGDVHDRSAARFEYVDPGTKRETRLAIAERAYERGWRSYRETMRPDCRSFELRRDGVVLLPWCTATCTHQTPSECGSGCPAFAPEPPGWRTKGWPIEGGPGRAITRLLERRRERARPDDP